MKTLLLILMLTATSACNAAQICWTDDDGYQNCTYAWDQEHGYYPPNKKTTCWTDPAGYTYCEEELF